MIWFILLLVVGFLLFLYFKNCKRLKVGSLVLVSGGVKCGKSTLSVHLAIKEYKKRVRKIRFKNWFLKLLKKPLLEEPLLYSNVPLAVPYVPLTNDLLTRQVRFNYKSVIYIQEASLVADSQLCHNQFLNENLSLFNKLIGHETRGGCLIYDTQSVADLHYSIKRCLSQYIYIHHLINIPLVPFLVACVREFNYSNDNSTLNVISDDIEESLKYVIIPKKVWKLFDCYCYSCLTDNLACVDSSNVVVADSLKCNKILSFKKGGGVNAKKDS